MGSPQVLKRRALDKVIGLLHDLVGAQRCPQVVVEGQKEEEGAVVASQHFPFHGAPQHPVVVFSTKTVGLLCNNECFKEWLLRKV